MAKKNISRVGYFGLDYVVSLILAIFIPTNVIFGIIIRAQKGNILGLILNIIIFPVFWIIDLITVAQKKPLWFLA